ncbi:MAG: cytochrome c oxidase subunit II [Nocardioidaceae bacterium]|nr:cytochrome c oxidase subunit II [Nocardioidaceae bacterium]
MGLPRVTRALTLSLGAVVLLLSGCSAETTDEWKRLAMPEPGTKESWQIFDFWRWSWVAALVVGVLVWALMLWVAVRYRRRSDDEIPVQTRYNIPLEILYTIAPVIIVIVFFANTVKIQHDIKSEVEHPDHTIVVTGQQWSWTFNYAGERRADGTYAGEPGTGGKNVYEAGTTSYIPTLVLPVDQTVEFELHSPDVIHSFWITGFLYKEDVIPGRVNTFQVTPDRIGDFKGKCAELCGAYHSRMLFNVRVVSEADYEAYLQEQMAKGFVSDAPLLGNQLTTTQAGLETGASEGAAQ